MSDRHAMLDVHETHPSLAVWEEELFAHGTVVAPDLADHLLQCHTCDHAVRQLAAWRDVVRRPAGTPAASVALRERILTSRAQGVRSIVPVHQPDSDDVHVVHDHAPPRRHWWSYVPVRTAAAAVAVLALAGVLREPAVAEAGMVAGSLQLMPARPQLGDTVHATYTTAGLLGKPPVLRLRARLRTNTDGSYNDGHAGVELAMLRRTGADRYEGRFVLPDSVVYAALAVEDTAGTAIDDFNGRAWDIVRSDADGRPLLSALKQRHNDLMGRSWEELLVTAREAVRFHPDSVDAWSTLQFVEDAMGVTNDSTRKVHQATAARLSARMLNGTLPMETGRVYWYTLRGDSALHAAWRTRLLRDAPTDEFAVQERAIRIYAAFGSSKDTAAALDSMETLWRDAPANRRAQVAQVALAMPGTTPAFASHLMRWTQRYRAVDSTIYRRQWIARQLATNASLRDTAVAQLSALAGELTAPHERDRRLNETRDQFARRMRDERVLTEATLGLVLTTAGRSREALERLRALPDVGWNADVFSAIASAAASAGDTALAVPHWARLVIDPRTPAARAARLDSAGTRAVGGQAWASLKTRMHAEMARNVMLDARARRVAPARVASLDGRTSSLTALAAGKPMVLIMFSPQCKPAVEALPRMRQVAERLDRQGVPVVMVAEQATAHETLRAMLAKVGYTAPVYVDADRQAHRALNNWGTPQLYVLDRDGRVMFDPTSDPGEAALRMEALLASGR